MSNDLSTNNESPKVVKHKGISAVWLVPIIALIFGSWLVYKAISERGTFITVQFDSANGIVVGKTQVKYKGLTAGTVRHVEVSEDLKSVIVEIEMISSASHALTDKTLFWYVTADISFQGVSGLDTLLSGSYIAVQPDFEAIGESQRHFIAIDEAPPLSYEVPGLHLTLKTNNLGSLGKNSPVTFKQIKVGYVSNYKFEGKGDDVQISLFIEPEYAHLVKQNSRFWNASGVSVSGSLTSGLNVKTNSLASIIAGGIAFDNSEYEAVLPQAQNGETFNLYDNFELAEMGRSITLILNWDSGLDSGAAIKYQGLTLGHIESFTKIDPESRQVVALAKVNPRVSPYLTDMTQLYVVAPEFDLGGVTNMRTMMMGTHIGIRPTTKGVKQDTFNVYSERPPLLYSEPGLHLALRATNIDSLNKNSGIFFQQVRVGNIQAIENLGPNDFLIHIHITEEYKEYVSTESRFWNASGLRVSGGIQDLEIQTQSIQAVLAGGIAFNNGITASNSHPANGTEFTLFNNKNIADESVTFTLKTQSIQGVNTNTRIMYRGNRVGSVHSIKHSADGVSLTVGVLPEHDYILKETSQFWLVKPNISLSGLADTEALFGGTYINLTVGKGKTTKAFYLSKIPPAKLLSADGIQLTLNTKEGNVVTAGSPISYRGIAVGQVDNVALDGSGENVSINITIDDEYKHLISSYTRFYNASGITAKGSLGNFIIKSESADALMRGGISFYNPTNSSQKVPFKEGQAFTLFNSIEDAEDAGIAITLYFDEIDGLRPHMNIKYKSQNIGSVERLIFNPENKGVQAIAYLNDNARSFAVRDTKFWFAQAELGLVGSKNLASTLEGGFIRILPGSSLEKNVDFIASNTPPVNKSLHYGLNLKLTSTVLGSVRVGDPVLYRQIPVGKVIGVDLSSTADEVDVYVHIAKRYMPLVQSSSKFWNASGINVSAGLFSGITVKSESLETLIAGGIAFATPENENNQTPEQGTQFTLHDSVNDSWLDWQPKIQLNDE